MNLETTFTMRFGLKDGISSVSQEAMNMLLRYLEDRLQRKTK